MSQGQVSPHSEIDEDTSNQNIRRNFICKHDSVTRFCSVEVELSCSCMKSKPVLIGKEIKSLSCMSGSSDTGSSRGQCPLQ